MQRRPGPLLLAIGLVVALLGGVAGFALGQHRSTPGDHSVEAGFARDMQTHHDQAVEMAWIVLDHTEDPRIRTLAHDIARTQENQSGQMAGWLRSWGLTATSPEPSMAWMARSGHAAHDGTDGVAAASAAQMPGMASASDLQRLRDARGRAADTLFLTLMMRHHEGGVPMAEAALRGAREPEVLDLARAIIRSQRAEVDTMRELRDDLR